MNDQEIRRRLQGFAAVWRRVSAANGGPEAAPAAPLMPLRRAECRERRRSARCPRRPW